MNIMLHVDYQNEIKFEHKGSLLLNKKQKDIEFILMQIK